MKGCQMRCKYQTIFFIAMRGLYRATIWISRLTSISADVVSPAHVLLANARRNQQKLQLYEK